jgi:salicylate hydroxylase
MDNKKPKFEEIGAGVSFGPNATRALGLMGGLDKDYFAIADSNAGENKNLWFDFRMFDGDHDYLTTV